MPSQVPDRSRLLECHSNEAKKKKKDNVMWFYYKSLQHSAPLINMISSSMISF